MNSTPTPYDDVNAMLSTLLSSVRDVLGLQLKGMILYGSLSLGDFDPTHSDIDFVAVTAGPLLGDTVTALAAMHARIAASDGPWSKRLEGAYIPLADLRRYDPAGGPYPMYNEGRLYLTRLGGDWIIQRHVMRDHGIALAGPPPATLIDPVTPDDLRWGVADVLQGWWAEQAEAPGWLAQDDGNRAFAVMTMARAFHTLHTGQIVSKPASARWAIAEMDEPWRSLVAEAAAWQPGERFGHMDETLAFIRYAIARSHDQHDAGSAV